MGLLDSLIAGAVRGAFDKFDTAGLPAILAQVLGRTDLGGLGGLVDALRRGGLDRQVGSWLGQGSNMPVSPDELRGAIGDRGLSQMAGGLGISIEDLLAMLSQHLPQTIDTLSPNGRLEEDRAVTGGGEDAEGSGGSLSDQAGLDDIDRLR
jgi:uncharacterized protein YidB (DUF937 family)